MTSDIEYNIKPPYTKNNWLIFKDSTFSKLQTADCNDATEGICYNNISFNECLDYCNKSYNCNYGYHISDLPNNKSICVPLNYSEYFNPVYKLRNKNIYKELENVKSKVFIDKNKYKFPPNDANNIFFMDNFLVKNVETSYILETSPIKNYSKIGFKKNGDLIVKIIKTPPNSISGVEYRKVKYGDDTTLNIPYTNLVIEDKNNIIDWVSKSFTISSDESFKILPISSDSNRDSYVYYSDEFYIYSNKTKSIISVDKNTNTLVNSKYSDYNEAKSHNLNVTFKFIPKIKGWYCKNRKCIETSLENMEIDENKIGYIDKTPVNRIKSCWNLCKKNNYKYNYKYIIINSIIIILILIIIFIIIKKYA